MREININGYLDEEVWFGDEITPEALHEVLYGLDGQARDDVHIYLNSYGGSCNAATRMFDDIRAYPGNVAITISGTAASAATVLAMAANRLEMTRGSLFMIHDPIVGVVGNEHELMDAIRLLRACKESILNVYAVRCSCSRSDVSERMTATCWMDAQSALADGFIDGISDGVRPGSPLNAGEAHVVNREEAEKKVKAWIERTAVRLSHSKEAELSTPVDNVVDNPVDSAVDNAAQTTEQPVETGTPVAQLHKRLGLIMPTRR